MAATVEMAASAAVAVVVVFMVNVKVEVRIFIYPGGNQLHMLFYADDIVMLAPTAERAQIQLNVLKEWCTKWHMRINAKNKRLYI